MLHEIARRELHMVEFRVVEDVRFRQNGRGNIELVANVREIFEKVRIGQFFRVFIYELFFDMTVCHQLRPNSHSSRSLWYMNIIHSFIKKVNRFLGEFSHFGIFDRG